MQSNATKENWCEERLFQQQDSDDDENEQDTDTQFCESLKSASLDFITDTATGSEINLNWMSRGKNTCQYRELSW